MEDKGIDGTSNPDLTRPKPWGWIAASIALFIGLLAALALAPTSPALNQTLRYPIPLPEGSLSFSLALSPDGLHVAIAAVAEEDTYIFVRSMDSWEFRRLQDTAGAQVPFWSPDSQTIAFFSDNQLKTVNFNGGPSEIVTNVRGLLGKAGSWGSDDVMVIAPASKFAPGPLLQVSASGGTTAPLTSTEPGESHRYPAFLPDGRSFLYTSIGGSRPGIYIASIDNPAGRRLLPDQSSAQASTLVPGGNMIYILFHRDGALWAQPFDIGTLDLAPSQPTQILDTVPLRDDQAAAISTSNQGTLAYFGGSNRETDSRNSWFDLSGTLLANEGSLGTAGSVSLSPDEQTVVFTRRTSTVSETTDQWRRNLSTGVETPLTLTNTVDKTSNAVWSPDGRYVVSSGIFDIFWKDVFGTAQEAPLVQTGDPKYPTDWSSDGRFILYTELEGTDDADLWYVEVDSVEGVLQASDPVSFLDTDLQESSGQFSPDGNWVAYTSNEGGEEAVFVRAFPSGDGFGRVSPGLGIQPRWSSDGTKLFYVTGPPFRRTLMRVDVSLSTSSTVGTPTRFEINSPEPLFDAQINAFHPAWGTFMYSVTDDGSRFLINHVEVTDAPVINIVTNWQQAFGLEE